MSFNRGGGLGREQANECRRRAIFSLLRSDGGPYPLEAMPCQEPRCPPSATHAIPPYFTLQDSSIHHLHVLTFLPNSFYLLAFAAVDALHLSPVHNLLPVNAVLRILPLRLGRRGILGSGLKGSFFSPLLRTSPLSFRLLTILRTCPLSLRALSILTLLVFNNQSVEVFWPGLMTFRTLRPGKCIHHNWTGRLFHSSLISRELTLSATGSRVQSR